MMAAATVAAQVAAFQPALEVAEVAAQRARSALARERPVAGGQPQPPAPSAAPLAPLDHAAEAADEGMAQARPAAKRPERPTPPASSSSEGDCRRSGGLPGALARRGGASRKEAKAASRTQPEAGGGGPGRLSAPLLAAHTARASVPAAATTWPVISEATWAAAAARAEARRGARAS